VSEEAIDPRYAPALRLVDAAFADDRLDPIPERLVSAAHQAFSWRLVDAELAELLFDSASDELVGVRGASTERRSFRYGSAGAVIRIHLTDASMIVMVEPPLSVGCRVDTEQGSHEYRTDDLGELVIDAPQLPVRLEVALPSGKVVTPWITG
jgi:YD repeat-containing protein